MTKFFSLILLLSITSTVFATQAELDVKQIKAVADAVIAQHKVDETESIAGIENANKPYQDDKVFTNNFTVKYRRADGTCQQEGVEVITTKSSMKSEVSFFRYPGQACQ